MLPKSKIQAKLDEEIISSLNKLESLKDKPDEYDIVVERIAKLHKLKTEERLKPPSIDTMLAVSANIFGILWLTRFEKEHVLNSKALGFVMKPRS